ncbi:MAG: hypothetical protein ABJB76_12080 [Candidatus Nitrosocosmicus sp.]
MSGYDQLAKQAVNLLTSLIIKGGGVFAERYGQKIAESLSEKTDKLFSLVKKKLDGDEDDKKDFENFQQKPERYSRQLVQILEEKIKNEKAFASDISSILQEIQNLNVNINIENSEAENITGIESNREKGNFSTTIKGSTAKKDLIGGKFNFNYVQK